MAEFAATLATQAGSLVLGTHHIEDRSLQDYWISSKCRLQRWQFSLCEVESKLRESPSKAESIWDDATPLIAEVLTSEILTRVWAAILFSTSYNHDCVQ